MVPSSSRAPRPRSFRLFLAGSLVSGIGDWMDLAALNWAVLQITGSPLDLGLINACRLAPVFALSLPAGVWADRYDRRRLLLATQFGLMLATFVVAGLVAVRAPFWVFATAVTLRSSLAAMVLPIRNAMLPNLVDQPSQAAAIAQHTAALNLSRIVGPALAGWLLAIVAVETVFWINGASFAAVLLATWLVRPPPNSARSQKSVVADLSEAFAYVRGHRLVRSLLVLAVVPMVFGFPYTGLMPLFARDLYGLGPEGYGLLLSFSAVGALIGAVWMSLFGGSRYGPRLVGAIVVFGGSLLCCAYVTGFALAAAAMLVVGWSSQSYRTLSRIVLQAEVPDRLRGRILSIALLDRGFIPLGAVMLGAIAAATDAQTAALVMGIGCIVLTLGIAVVDRRIWRL